MSHYEPYLPVATNRWGQPNRDGRQVSLGTALRQIYFRDNPQARPEWNNLQVNQRVTEEVFHGGHLISAPYTTVTRAVGEQRFLEEIGAPALTARDMFDFWAQRDFKSSYPVGHNQHGREIGVQPPAPADLVALIAMESQPDYTHLETDLQAAFVDQQEALEARLTAQERDIQAAFVDQQQALQAALVTVTEGQEENRDAIEDLKDAQQRIAGIVVEQGKKVRSAQKFATIAGVAAIGAALVVGVMA